MSDYSHFPKLMYIWMSHHFSLWSRGLVVRAIFILFFIEMYMDSLYFSNKKSQPSSVRAPTENTAIVTSLGRLEAKKDKNNTFLLTVSFIKGGKKKTCYYFSRVFNGNSVEQSVHCSKGSFRKERKWWPLTLYSHLRPSTGWRAG